MALAFDDIAVLFKGQKVDACDRAALFNQPRHPYTSLLIDSVPEMRANWLEEMALRPKAD